jgi:hypothetical protein
LAPDAPWSCSPPPPAPVAVYQARSLPLPTSQPRSSLRVVRFDSFSFGSLSIDGVAYDHDVMIDRGSIARRRKKKSKPFRDAYGHTPLSPDEDIPWECRRLVIGTGAAGALPIMEGVIREAERRGVEVVALPTTEAVDLLRDSPAETNAILHVTC